MDGAERAAEHRRVVGVAEHRAAADHPLAGEDAVAVAGAVAEMRRARGGADQPQRAGVAERLEALQRDAALAVGDRRHRESLDDAHESDPRIASTALWPPKPNESLIATGGAPLTASGCGPSVT